MPGRDLSQGLVSPTVVRAAFNRCYDPDPGLNDMKSQLIALLNQQLQRVESILEWCQSTERDYWLGKRDGISASLIVVRKFDLRSVG